MSQTSKPPTTPSNAPPPPPPMADEGRPRPPMPDRFREGETARSIEHRTAQLPSDAFLWTAGGIAAASLTMMLCGRRTGSLFVGQWVAPVLVCGLYNKLVKTVGHDRRG